MSHDVIIKLEDFCERAFTDTDNCEWWELLDLDPCKEGLVPPIEIETDDAEDDSEAEAERLTEWRDEAGRLLLEKYAGKCIVASWASNIIARKYDSDGSYSSPKPLTEALEDAPEAEVYGEPERIRLANLYTAEQIAAVEKLTARVGLEAHFYAFQERSHYNATPGEWLFDNADFPRDALVALELSDWPECEGCGEVPALHNLNGERVCVQCAREVLADDLVNAG